MGLPLAVRFFLIRMGLVVLCIAPSAVRAQEKLAGLPHPRLWFPKSSEGWVREKIATDPLASDLHRGVMEVAESILSERTCRHEIPDGLRLLGESRLALRNVMISAWAWRMSGDERFRLRVIRELEAACAMQDWNPKHFLDVAEMATAVATGYDWLHGSLTPAQREMCETAIVDKALKPARAEYLRNVGWSRPIHNWSQVCGAGIALAAAAIAGNDQGLSDELFERGKNLIQQCEVLYAPDGMYAEGPSYWHYGSNYHVMLVAACEPLRRTAGETALLRKAGDSIMHLTGPKRWGFNFADAGASRERPSPAQCWLAARYEDAIQTGHVRRLFRRALREDGKGLCKERYFPLAILWLPEAKPDVFPPNAAVFGGGQSVAAFRTGWNEHDAFFAVKGGTPAANHGHMDVGSFVYDALGHRWIHDLGAENYNLPGYFGKNRWDYFRLQNRSHNTLEIGDRLQAAKAMPSPVTESSLAGNPLVATIDLSSAYQGAADKVARTVRFHATRGLVRIEDNIEAPAGPVVWRAFTDAKAELDRDRVILSKGDEKIVIRRVSPAGTWTITDAKPPTAEENPNEKFRAIVLTVPQARSVALVVEIDPGPLEAGSDDGSAR